MDSTYFSSPEFQFWVKILTDICIRNNWACRPFSNLFSTLAYAKLELADQDTALKKRCKDAGVELVHSLGGKPMLRAEHYYLVMNQEE